MFITISLILFTLFIPCLLLAAISSISFQSHKDREKSSPFECGFDPKASARLPFSMRFFLLAVLFLVFDIEIMLLMPMCLSPMNLTQTFSLPAILFTLILILGLLHEWNEGSLDWSN